MTTTAKHLLSEIVAGLDGVSEGPWTLARGLSGLSVGVRGTDGRQIASSSWHHCSPHYPTERTTVTNFDHIARLSPDRIRAIAAYVEQLEKALEPFAKAAVEHDGQDRDEWRHHDDNELVESSDALTELTAGDFRRARAALGGSVDE